jgi:hypothetical protein
MSYRDRVRIEIEAWEHRFLKPPGYFEQASKKLSNKINTWIPKKVHQTITTTVKMIIRSALFGVEYSPKRSVNAGIDLEMADQQAEELIKRYQKIAVAEGAGTGAGGIMLSVVDFPALIAIKMRFLFELAHVYGFSTKTFSERIFILQLFQLNYANLTKRPIIYAEIQQWSEMQKSWKNEKEFYQQMDWEQFQKDYRDALDFRKMLQILPGIGAIAGAWANYGILQEISETAKNGYRLRHLFQSPDI